MKVAILSCGRSDFSYYLPLIKKLKADNYFGLDIIAFGTHVSEFFGHTVDWFYEEGFKVKHQIESLVLGDSPEAISTAIGLTVTKFSSIWAQEKYDLIFCLGDRYEMFAAVTAAVPFGIKIAHLHGGETTLGAIDNVFRHSITLMSSYHFTATENYANRVKQITGNNKNVFNVGSLCIDNMKQALLLTPAQFEKKYKINLTIPTVLCTFHPETVAYEKNTIYTDELVETLKNIDYQVVITMPNSDTRANYIRDKLKYLISSNKRIFGFEALGVLGYYSCLKNCKFLIGNSSSGIIEAASFGKYVINLGDRQKGREHGENVLNVKFNRNAILKAVARVIKMPKLNNQNIYGDGKTADRIVKILKNLK